MIKTFLEIFASQLNYISKNHPYLQTASDRDTIRVSDLTVHLFKNLIEPYKFVCLIKSKSTLLISENFWESCRSIREAYCLVYEFGVCMMSSFFMLE